MNGCVCRWFVEDNPGEVCPVAGRAAYRDCLRLTRLEGDTAEGHPQYAVNASSFMAFHSILKTSQVRSLICTSGRAELFFCITKSLCDIWLKLSIWKVSCQQKLPSGRKRSHRISGLLLICTLTSTEYGRTYLCLRWS